MPTKKRQGQGRRQEMGTKVVRGGAIGKVVMCTASGASGVWIISMVTEVVTMCGEGAHDGHM